MTDNPSQRQTQQTQNPIEHETQQAERVTIIERDARSNPGWQLLKIVTWPLLKLAGFIALLIGLIIREMVRSIVGFIMGIVLMVGSAGVMVLYGVAFVDSNFDVITALHLVAERISLFVQGLI